MRVKISAFLLVSLLVLTACTGNGPTVTGDPFISGPVQETEAESTTLYTPDSLPADLDLGGKTVSFFVWSDTPGTEFYIEEQTGEIVDDAIYNRNLTVSSRLNVEFKFTEILGNYNNRTAFVSAVRSSVLAGDGAYDIVAGYSMSGATLAASELTQNLLEVEYLDFSKPWWPERLIVEAKVGDYLPFASGDISTSMLYMMYCVYFNKTMLENNNLENPYEMVTAGTWTLDNMIRLTEGMYTDLNGDGKKNKDDKYGFVTHSTYVDPFFYASGLNTTERDADGIPVISPKFGSGKTQELIVKITSMFYNGNDAYLYTDYDQVRTNFKVGNALLNQTEAVYAKKYLRDADFDYGILPVPKWDEKQEEYITCMSFPYSLYLIPVDIEDTSPSGAVLECMASESYRQVSPALFEIAMKIKYSIDDEASVMYDIIRSGVSFDIGRIFNDSMGNITYNMFRNAVVNNNKDWASLYKSNENYLQTRFYGVMETLIK